MIDKIIEKVIDREVPDKEIAVLLSGGVDSLSVACAAHRLGKKVHGYTFHLDGNKSYDARKAEEAKGHIVSVHEFSDEGVDGYEIIVKANIKINIKLNVKLNKINLNFITFFIIYFLQTKN